MPLPAETTRNIAADIATKGCRRRERVRKLIDALDRYAGERGLTVRRISQTKVKTTFLLLGIRNKNQMAHKRCGQKESTAGNHRKRRNAHQPEILTWAARPAEKVSNRSFFAGLLDV